MQVPVWFGMAAACLLGLSTASTHAAPQVHAQPANTRDVQFHSYLEQAAEAMQKGDLAPLLKSFDALWPSIPVHLPLFAELDVYFCALLRPNFTETICGHNPSAAVS